MNLLRANWGLRRVNLGMAVASLLFLGITAACTEGANTDEPIYTPTPPTTTTTTAYELTAEDVVDAMGADVVAAGCKTIADSRALGLSDREMFSYFAEGFGEPVGDVSAADVWAEIKSRCRS